MAPTICSSAATRSGDFLIEVERTLSAADRANNAVVRERDGRWVVLGDPTEGALIVAARKIGLSEENLAARFERVGEVPFSAERKLMTTLHHDAEQPERLLAFTKGAPDVLLLRCTHELVGTDLRQLTPERLVEDAEAILGLSEWAAESREWTAGYTFRS